jgi:beta-glucosidase
VVLMKNSGGLLPLRPEQLAGQKVYVELFEQNLTVATLDGLRASLAESHPDLTFTTDFSGADVAVLFLNPFTGDYFHSVGLLDLRIHEATHVNLAKVRAIRAAVPKLVVSLNVMLPWLLGTVEPLADGLLAGFDTDLDAVFDVIVGEAAPSGRLPLTFPINDDAVAVDEAGVCASPNDVPGYDKETYMDGRRYVYVDADGHRYRSGHGLSYS